MDGEERCITVRGSLRGIQDDLYRRTKVYLGRERREAQIDEWEKEGAMIGQVE